MTTLNAGDGNATLINTFQAKPGRADDLIAALKKATDETVKNIPGFVSANLHRSLDGKKVVNYAQWKSKDAFEAAMKNPTFQAHMKDIADLAESYDPVLYELQYAESRN